MKNKKKSKWVLQILIIIYLYDLLSIFINKNNNDLDTKENKLTYNFHGSEQCQPDAMNSP